jgi:hypothetical protein
MCRSSRPSFRCRRSPARRRTPTATSRGIGSLTQLFGFVQLELPGAIAIPDGRYLAREDDDEASQRVLVVETLGAPAPPGRRRRRARSSEPGAEPPTLPLARLTAVRAHEPFASREQAEAWLAGALGGEEAVDSLVADAAALANRALHARAVAAADPGEGELRPERAAAVRIGYGSGEEVASGRFTVASTVDVRGGASPRRRREEDLRPQERLAVVLGGRGSLDACETLLLRARSDLDAGRMREAALQLRVALEALLVELAGALADPGHGEDMATLEARKGEAGAAANAALRADLGDEQARQVRELVETCERVLRRRRILRS